MENYENYRRQMEAQIEEFDAEIQKLKAKSKKASAQASIEYRKTIENLEGKLDEAKKKLKGLANAGGDAWDELKRGFEMARADIKAAVKSAQTQLEASRKS